MNGQRRATDLWPFGIFAVLPLHFKPNYHSHQTEQGDECDRRPSNPDPRDRIGPHQPNQFLEYRQNVGHQHIVASLRFAGLVALMAFRLSSRARVHAVACAVIIPGARKDRAGDYGCY